MYVHQLYTYIYLFIYFPSSSLFPKGNSQFTGKLIETGNYHQRKDESDIKLMGILELLGQCFLASELPCNHGNNGNGTNCIAYIIPHRRECFHSPKF